MGMGMGMDGSTARGRTVQPGTLRSESSSPHSKSNVLKTPGPVSTGGATDRFGGHGQDATPTLQRPTGRGLDD